MTQALPGAGPRHDAGTAWSPEREAAAIVQHLARCCFCRALLTHGQRRRDRALLEAAERLAEEHAENDAEREAFARQRAGGAGDCMSAGEREAVRRR